MTFEEGQLVEVKYDPASSCGGLGFYYTAGDKGTVVKVSGTFASVDFSEHQSRGVGNGVWYVPLRCLIPTEGDTV